MKCIFINIFWLLFINTQIGYTQYYEMYLDRSFGSNVITTSFSFDSSTIAVGCSNGNLYLWEIINNEINGLEGHIGNVNQAIFSIDSRYLYTVGSDGRLICWDVSTHNIVGQNDFGDSVNLVSLALLPKQNKVYSGGDTYEIYETDLTTWKTKSIFKSKFHHSLTNDSVLYKITDIQKLDDQKIAFCAGDLFFSTVTNNQFAIIGRIHNIDKNFCTMTILGQNLAIWKSNGEVQFWKNYNQKDSFNILMDAGLGTYVPNITFITEEILLTGGYGINALIWNLNSENSIQLLTGHSLPVTSVCASPSGKLIATGGLDKRVILWKKFDIHKAILEKDIDYIFEKLEQIIKKYKTYNYNSTESNQTINHEYDFLLKIPIPLPNVEFKLNDLTLLQEAYPTLDKLIKFLKKNPNVEILLTGHTEPVMGRDIILKENSFKRAKTIKSYLVSAGIEMRRISVEGRGGQFPIVKYQDSVTNKTNRRVEFNILKF